MSEATTLKLTRAFVTPEGVDLRLQLADASQRAAAFFVDAAIMLLVLIVASLLIGLIGVGALAAAGLKGAEMIAVVWLLGFFLLRNFYFVGFELSAAAATPGKRAMGIRVAARDGGRLRPGAIFARNAMRELEVFIPISMLFAPAGVEGGGVEGWMYLLGITWAGVFVLFPLFNKDRLRAGDLIGGTWVVRAPKRKLMRDMADEGAERLQRYAFTLEQIDAYGAKELHVLEDVLRERDRKTMRAVADRIAGKIGWTRLAQEDDYDFLSAYYAALRKRLEARLLMGVRRRDKHDTAR
ncbi:RDD family protein [Caulobacter flavus]|uniref:RDD family protein n=1 Tax=Caulobacter flavus TaxID=1679497 RepID=A0A2N5CNR5_9CAUL|nr:RDD family protein [Caulobacter flavus]AYV48682.1 RDD family protein [Caulobacter flavus]PLR08603.1 RDD family protein [Caulobacter flavus]